MITKFTTSATPVKEGGNTTAWIIGCLIAAGLAYYFFSYKPAQEKKQKEALANG